MGRLNLLIPVIILTLNLSVAQDNVAKVDLKQYSGKWFVIAATPEAFDKEWNFITESYSLNDNGNIEISNTYIKLNKTKQQTASSRGFPINEKNNLEWKVRFSSPLKSDYVIEELPPGYTYAVIGHPEKKYVYILSRTSIMEDDVYKMLVGRCKTKGYDVSQLRKIPQ